MQLNVVFRLKKYMSQKKLEVNLNSFMYYDFIYCLLLIWHFSTNKSIKKIENIHKTLLDKRIKESMKITRIKTLEIGIFKTEPENLNVNKVCFAN